MYLQVNTVADMLLFHVFRCSDRVGKHPTTKALAETFNGGAGFQDCFYVLVEEFDLEPVAESMTVQNTPMITSLASALQHVGSSGAQQSGLVSLVDATKADIRDHLLRFQPGSRNWVFVEYFKWLVQAADNVGDKQERQRAFIIYGDAGVGKSTIAAKLARKPDTHINAHHFCKHSDEK